MNGVYDSFLIKAESQGGDFLGDAFHLRYDFKREMITTCHGEVLYAMA
jgi:hypothetical protein